jgi:hypothetical protein
MTPRNIIIIIITFRLSGKPLLHSMFSRKTVPNQNCCVWAFPVFGKKKKSYGLTALKGHGDQTSQQGGAVCAVSLTLTVLSSPGYQLTRSILSNGCHLQRFMGTAWAPRFPTGPLGRLEIP